jgi:hypothetical protein
MLPSQSFDRLGSQLIAFSLRPIVPNSLTMFHKPSAVGRRERRAEDAKMPRRFPKCGVCS